MRTTFSVPSRKRRKRVLKTARGFYGARSKRLRTVYDAVDKAKSYAYEGRKQKKRQFRRLWTVRINAACKANGLNYSQFVHGLKLASVDLNRKMVSEMAIHNPDAFVALAEKAKEAIKAVAK